MDISEAIIITFLIIAPVCWGFVLFKFHFPHRKKKDELSSEPFPGPDEFHNNFTKVGSGDEHMVVKPIDYSRNPILEGQREIENDLAKIFPPEKEEPKKE